MDELPRLPTVYQVTLYLQVPSLELGVSLALSLLNRQWTAYETIDFAGTSLAGKSLTSLNIPLGGPFEYIDIDNFCYVAEYQYSVPIIDIKDASLVAIPNNGPASASNNTDFETVCGTIPITNTYNITNTARSELAFTGAEPVYVVLGGTNADQFSIRVQHGSTVGIGLTTTYISTTTRSYSGTITSLSTDPSNASFVFNVALIETLSQ